MENFYNFDANFQHSKQNMRLPQDSGEPKFPKQIHGFYTSQSTQQNDSYENILSLLHKQRENIDSVLEKAKLMKQSRHQLKTQLQNINNELFNELYSYESQTTSAVGQLKYKIQQIKDEKPMQAKNNKIYQSFQQSNSFNNPQNNRYLQDSNSNMGCTSPVNNNQIDQNFINNCELRFSSDNQPMSARKLNKSFELPKNIKEYLTNSEDTDNKLNQSSFLINKQTRLKRANKNLEIEDPARNTTNQFFRKTVVAQNKQVIFPKVQFNKQLEQQNNNTKTSKNSHSAQKNFFQNTESQNSQNFKEQSLNRIKEMQSEITKNRSYSNNTNNQCKEKKKLSKIEKNNLPSSEESEHNIRSQSEQRQPSTAISITNNQVSLTQQQQKKNDILSEIKEQSKQLLICQRKNISLELQQKQQDQSIQQQINSEDQQNEQQLNTDQKDAGIRKSLNNEKQIEGNFIQQRNSLSLNNNDPDRHDQLKKIYLQPQRITQQNGKVNKGIFKSSNNESQKDEFIDNMRLNNNKRNSNSNSPEIGKKGHPKIQGYTPGKFDKQLANKKNIKKKIIQLDENLFSLYKQTCSPTTSRSSKISYGQSNTKDNLLFQSSETLEVKTNEYYKKFDQTIMQQCEDNLQMLGYLYEKSQCKSKQELLQKLNEFKKQFGDQSQSQNMVLQNLKKQYHHLQKFNFSDEKFIM